MYCAWLRSCWKVRLSRDSRAQAKDMMNRENILIFAMLLIATIFSVAGQSFNFPFNNNAHHIPFVLDYANSAEGPSDIYHHSLSRFISAFWVLIGAVATEENIYAVFLGAHILFRFLILFAIWKIASLLSGHRAISAAAPICFIVFFPGFYHFSPIGKSELFAPYLTHSQAVIAVVLIGWYFLIRRQFLAAAAVTALAFDFNAFVGIWLGVVAGCAMIYVNWNKGLAWLSVHSVKMLLIFLALASPVIVWLLYSVFSVPPFEEFDYRSYLIDFYPYHNYFIHHLQETTAFIVFLGAGWLTLRWTGPAWDKDRLKIVSAIFAAYTAIFLVGMVLPYVTGNRLILNLVPLRMDSYLIFLISILILAWHNPTSSNDHQQDRSFPIIALFSLVNGNVLLFIAALFLGRNFEGKSALEKFFGWVLMGGLLASHLYFEQAAVLFSLPVKHQMFAFALQSGVIALFLLGHPRYLSLAFIFISIASLKLLPEIDTFPTAAILILTYVLIAVSVTRNMGWLSFGPAVLILSILAINPVKLHILLICGAFLMPVLALQGFSLLNKMMPVRLFSHANMLTAVFIGLLAMGAFNAYLRGGLANFPNEAIAFEEAQIWARENTEPHTLFLPIGKSGFSSLSRRPVWMEPTMGAMIMWAPETHDFWSTRISKLRQIKTVSQAMSLALAEGIPYIFINKSVVPMDPDYSHCIAYENQSYVILRSC